MQATYDVQQILKASERSTWRVEDLIGADKPLDFTRPFMPESFARTTPLSDLSPAEQVTMNQIRGHEYLSIFGLVEEFILPFVLDHVRPHLDQDDHHVRAMLRFASEEAKHIHLFRRFKATFEEGFGVTCPVIGPASAVAHQVLSHEPLAVALAILHIEWMTQRHYVDSVKGDEALDPQFKSLLRHHWMEEAQHAKLDTLMVEALAKGRTAEEIDRAIEGYLAIGGFLDAGLMQQVDLNTAAFVEATGRRLTAAQTQRMQAVQRQAVRWTYLGTGMTHPNFLATVDAIRPGAAQRLRAVAQAFC